jgi:hypothetical protein
MSFVRNLTKCLPLIRWQSFLLKIADSLGRYLLKLVGPRFSDQYRDLIVRWRTATWIGEFLNGRIPLGTALAVLVEEVPGESCDLESFITTTNIVTVFNLVTKGAYFASQGIAIDLGQVL